METSLNRFESRTVLVTGGSSGIGLAAARAFAAEGARVVVTGRDRAALERTEAELGPPALALVNDAADPAQARALAGALARHGLMLDAVFLNAGVGRFASLEAVDEAFWDRLFDTNLKGPFFQLQALLPRLNRGASVVLNGSINAHIGMPHSSVYSATKAGLVSLARTLSAELLPRGVRVNVVSPGPVDTPIYDKLGLDASALQGLADQIRAQVPLGRFGTPEEVAATVLHLAAPASAFIVGTEVVVDGGMSRL